MRKNILVLFLFLGLLVLIPAISLLTTHQSQDVRSRASEIKMLPALAPMTPFIRAGKSKDRVKKGELVPVYITAKSNELRVVEAYIVLSYDPSAFIVEEKHIRNENIFPTLNVVGNEPGRVTFSLFGNTEAGFEPVQIAEEKILATVFFSVIGETGEYAFELIREGEEKTALYASRDENTGIVPDILSSTQHASIHIE